MLAITPSDRPKAGRPRLLIASIQFPWPRGGGQQAATLSDLRSLSTAFDIDVVCYVDPVNVRARDEGIAALGSLLPNVSFAPVLHPILGRSPWQKAGIFLRASLRREPFLVNKFRSHRYLATVTQLVQKNTYDAIYLENPQTAWLLDSLPLTGERRPLLIYRVHDAVAETSATYARALGLRPTALAARIDSLITRRYERRLWKRVEMLLPMTKRLGLHIQSEVPNAADKISYFPVVVDATPAASERSRGNRHVLYVGTAHYPPNLHGLRWFLDKCWPLVRAQCPDAVLEIAGRGSEVLRPRDASVILRGYVEDLSQSYERAAVFVVPLFSGSGVRIKILDAIVQRLPVVSTSIGYAGLELQPGEHIAVADTPELFARHICQLLADPPKAEQLAERALAVVARNHARGAADAVVQKLAERCAARQTR